MIVQALCFWLFALMSVASGVMVISARNPVHSVLFLILAFFNAAGLFVLLGGTNRLKTEAEVKGDKDRVRGAEELKKALGRLAVGERVSWVHRIKGFEFPSESLRKEIQDAAKSAKIDLKIAPQKD